jgi:hypothetical protein
LIKLRVRYWFPIPSLMIILQPIPHGQKMTDQFILQYRVKMVEGLLVYQLIQESSP